MPRPVIPAKAPGEFRTASVGILKATLALVLMALFFTLFLIAPGPTAGGALIAVALVELFRHR